jgi:hypothetical protein
MSLVTREVTALELSTAETEASPLLEWGRDGVSLRYDGEGEDGARWVTLLFEAVRGLRYTADTAVSPWMVEAYSKICEVVNSTWVPELAGSSNESPGASERARHFFVYFDHVGCFEVVAADVQVRGAITDPSP